MDVVKRLIITKNRKIELGRLLSTVLLLLFGTSISKPQEIFQSPKLVKVWETPQGLNVPESSFYNKKDKTIYVSNICGMHNIKDSIGFISKLTDKGDFIEKEWISGLNAPKGINVYKGKLYVTDIDEVLEIDLKTKEILNRYRNSKASSLNDVAIDKTGRVYITDTKSNRIYFVGKDSLEIFIESDDINRTNGILVYKNHLICGSKNNLIYINIKTKNIEIIADSTGYIDGIVAIGNKNIVVSDWKGKVQLVEIDKGVETLLNTTPLNIYAADLGYIKSQKLLLVPTFSDNKIIAYRINN
jgi:sugar lactone lactonase YvrE